MSFSLLVACLLASLALCHQPAFSPGPAQRSSGSWMKKKQTVCLLSAIQEYCTSAHDMVGNRGQKYLDNRVKNRRPAYDTPQKLRDVNDTSNIAVYVHLSSLYAKPTILVKGQDNSIITELERKSFGIEDMPLKWAVMKYMKWPTQVWLCSPTPYYDIYQTKRWPQVRRILRPINGTVIRNRKTTEVIATERFVNRGNTEATYTANLKASVPTTFTSSWTSNTGINTTNKVTYKLKVKRPNKGASKQRHFTSKSFTNTFGVSNSESEATTYATEASVTVVVPAGAVTTASLTASKGVLEVQVNYEATLEGNLIAYYSGMYKGDYYWGFDVNSIMNTSGIPLTVDNSEIIKFELYYDFQIELDNGDKQKLTPTVVF